MVQVSSTRDVFINCPFDDDYKPCFRALVFAVRACGFRARTTLEINDGSETRIEKLYRLIEQCRYGVHDISRTELDEANGLPRFNMPLELGIFLGAKRFGEEPHKKKRALVLDTERYRYQKFVSDLAGVDPTPHHGDPRKIVEVVRSWLSSASSRTTIPTPKKLLSSYDDFLAGLPEIATTAGLHADSMEFPDFERVTVAWVNTQRQAGNL